MSHHHQNVGDQIVEFKLKNKQNEKIMPMSLKDKRILISFNPIAWTSVFEIKMRTLEVKKSKFDELKVISFGISVDSVQSKKAWAKPIEVKDYDLLADFWSHGKVAEKYGLFIEDEMVSNRANVLIGLDRTIVWIRVYELTQIPDIEEVIQFISSKQAIKKKQ